VAIANQSHTVFQRATGSGSTTHSIFKLQTSGAQNVSFFNMTLDGNRAGNPPPAPNPNISDPYLDLDLDLFQQGNTSNCEVDEVTFKNSPGYGVGPCTSYTKITGTFTGAFETGVLGFTPLNNLTITESTFSSNGGGGVALSSAPSSQITSISISSNDFEGNGAEFPDSTLTAQLFLDIETNGVTIELNIFDGENIDMGGVPCPGVLMKTCDIRGIEGYGANHTLYGNTFENHSATGIDYRGIQGSYSCIIRGRHPQ
jgi:hypothetical protein